MRKREKKTPMAYTVNPEMHVVYYKQPMTPSLRVIAIRENSAALLYKGSWLVQREMCGR